MLDRKNTISRDTERERETERFPLCTRVFVTHKKKLSNMQYHMIQRGVYDKIKKYNIFILMHIFTYHMLHS